MTCSYPVFEFVDNSRVAEHHYHQRHHERDEKDRRRDCLLRSKTTVYTPWYTYYAHSMVHLLYTPHGTQVPLTMSVLRIPMAVTYAE